MFMDPQEDEAFNRQNTIAVFGGSFNPPHIGHVLAAQYVMSAFRPERLIVVPCVGHAYGKDNLPFEDRFKMCKMAFELVWGVEVSDLATHKGLEKGYTFDLLSHLATRYPDKRIELIVGQDAWMDIRDNKWHRSKDLQAVFNIVIVPRRKVTPRAPIDVIKYEFYPVPDVSSSEIRMMIKNGLDCSRLLPATVLSYIQENELYLGKETTCPR
jgi:nicotinate-nucleotide adenylyltransferase